MELVDVALNIRQARKAKGMTLAGLAKASGVTKGYVSQVENFRTTPSLAVLCRLAEALSVEPGALLKGGSVRKRYVVTRSGAGEEVERESPDSGFEYRALAREKGGKLMEPFLLSLPPGSTRRDVTTDGDQFIHVLSGSVDFVLGKEKVKLVRGDSLYFDGSVPHHPENNTKKAASVLVLYALRTGSEGGAR